MKIERLIWLDEIVEKLYRKHQVSQYEVREVLKNKPRYTFVEKGHRKDENVYAAAGQTFAGRYLMVFFVYKANKHALIISAREMTKPERRRYGKK